VQAAGERLDEPALSLTEFDRMMLLYGFLARDLADLLIQAADILYYLSKAMRMRAAVLLVVARQYGAA
jgi:hypothetical protein